MQITRYTDYALRVLIYLGLKPNCLCSIQEIASAYQISQNHLMKIVHHMSKADFIKTVRGRNGGLQLSKRPEQISIGSVVRYTQETICPIDCTDCIVRTNCNLINIFYHAFKEFYSYLDNFTLADILKDPKGNPLQIIPYPSI